MARRERRRRQRGLCGPFPEAFAIRKRHRARLDRAAVLRRGNLEPQRRAVELALGVRIELDVADDRRRFDAAIDRRPESGGAAAGPAEHQVADFHLARREEIRVERDATLARCPF